MRIGLGNALTIYRIGNLAPVISEVPVLQFDVSYIETPGYDLLPVRPIELTPNPALWADAANLRTCEPVEDLEFIASDAGREPVGQIAAEVDPTENLIETETADAFASSGERAEATIAEFFYWTFTVNDAEWSAKAHVEVAEGETNTIEYAVTGELEHGRRFRETEPFEMSLETVDATPLGEYSAAEAVDFDATLWDLEAQDAVWIDGPLTAAEPAELRLVFDFNEWGVYGKAIWENNHRTTAGGGPTSWEDPRQWETWTDGYGRVQHTPGALHMLVGMHPDSRTNWDPAYRETQTPSIQFDIPAAEWSWDGAPGGVSYGLMQWLDASSDLDPVFNSTNRTQASDGEKVLRWRDLTGKGNDMTQVWKENQPVYAALGINGLPSLRFDGADDYLELDKVYDARLTTKAFTAVMVLQPEQLDAKQNFFANYVPGEEKGYQLRLDTDNKLYALVGDGDYVELTGGRKGFENQPLLLTLRVEHDGQAQLRVNDYETNLYVNHLANDRFPIYLGASHDIQAFRYPFHGMLGEVALYNRAVTDAELAQIETHLAGKWNADTRWLDTRRVSPLEFTAPDATASAQIDIPLEVDRQFHFAARYHNTSDGAAVDNWYDLAGSNTPMVSDGMPPVFRTSGMDVQPALEFMGAQRLRYEKTNFVHSNPFTTIVVVKKRDELATGEHLFGAKRDLGNNRSWNVITFEATHLDTGRAKLSFEQSRYLSGSTFYRTKGSVDDDVVRSGEAMILGLRHGTDQASADIFLNNRSLPITYSAQQAIFGDDDYDFYLGNTGISDLGFDGFVAEIVCFPTALSDSDLQTMFDWLGKIYGITVEHFATTGPGPGLEYMPSVTYIQSSSPSSQDAIPLPYMQLDAGAMQIYADGDPVFVWSDKNAQAHYAEQDTDAAKPTFVASEALFNNKAVMRFDGGDSLKLPTAFFNADSDEAAMFIVAKGSGEMLSTGAAGEGWRWSLAAGAEHEYLHEGAAGADNVQTLGSDDVRIYQVERVGSTVQLGINGGWESADQAGFNPAAIEETLVADGFTGDVAEIIVYDRVLSKSETYQVEDYLALKYGFTIVRDEWIFDAEALHYSGSQYVSGYGGPWNYDYTSERPIKPTRLRTTKNTRHGASFGFYGREADGTWTQLFSSGVTEGWTEHVLPEDTAAYTELRMSLIDPKPSSGSTTVSWEIYGEEGLYPIPDAHLDAGDLGLTDGAAVTAWNDHNTDRQTADQTTAASQPTYVTSGIANKPAVSFDGADDFLNLSTFAFSNENATVLIVASRASQESTLLAGDGTSDSPAILAGYAGGDFEWFDGAAERAGFGDYRRPQILSLVRDSVAGTVRGFENGTEIFNVAIAGDALDGRTFARLAADLAGTAFFDGMIAEIMTFNKALPDNQRQGAESYLIEKYDVVAPESPTLSSATADDTQAALVWTAPADADVAGYKVAYGTSAGVYDSVVDVGLVTSHTVTGLANGQTYYFAVKAYDEVPNDGSYSNELTATPADTTAPAAPTLDSAAPDNGQVTLAWTAPADADVAGYKVAYGTAAGVYDSTIDVGNVTTYDVTSLTNEQEYFFAVLAYDEVPNVGAYSNELTAKPSSLVLVSPDNMTTNTNPAPYVASASGEYTGTYQAWKAFDGDPLAGAWLHYNVADAWLQIDLGEIKKVEMYRIYEYHSSYNPTACQLKGSIDGVSWTEVDSQSGFDLTAQGDGGYLEFTLAAAAQYRYWRLQVQGGPSGQGLMLHELYGGPAEDDGVAPAAATLDNATPDDSKVDLAWTPPADNDVDGYKVYIGTASGVYDTPIDVGNVTDYVATGLTNDQQYFFVVTAYDVWGNESVYSNELSAVPAAALPIEQQADMRFDGPALALADGDPVATWPDSVNGFDLTYDAGTQQVYDATKFGGSVFFDDGRMAFGHGSFLDNLPDGITIAMMMNLGADSENFYRLLDLDNTDSFRAFADSGKSQVTWSINGNAAVASYSPNGQDVIIILSKRTDGSQYLEIDGVAATGAGSTAPTTDRSALKIGGWNRSPDSNYDSGYRAITGHIAELLVYKRGITDAEITELKTYLNDKYLGLPSGAALHVDAESLTGFNDGDAVTSITDETGKTLTGGASYVASSVNAKPALAFNGSQFLGAGTQLAPGGTYSTEATVFAVIKPSSVSGMNAIASDMASNGASATKWGTLSLGDYWTGSGQVFGGMGDGSNWDGYISDGVVAAVGTPVIVGIRAANDLIEVYDANGKLAATASNNATTTYGGQGANNFAIGRLGDFNGHYYSGDVAEVIVYDRALTDAEIAQVQSFLKNKYAL